MNFHKRKNKNSKNLHESVEWGIMEGCVSAGISAVATTRSSPQAGKNEKKKNQWNELTLFSMGYFGPTRGLNSDLPIQSQVCLPLDQGFMKIAKNMKKFWPGFLKLKF